jgi:MATE family multidrug resistance protein
MTYALTAPARPRRSAWMAEARGTLALAWPLILANLAQVAITTTDVLMMGRLGPRALAAGTLGTNLYFAVFIFGLGLVTATAPMFAQALGRGAGARRDVRRTARQGFWVAAGYAALAWSVLWHAGDILRLMGQDPALAAAAGEFVRALQWGILPALWFVVLRSFVAALERPMAATLITVAAIGLNALANWVLIFGRLGAPALGLTGSGLASTIANAFMAAALLAVVLWDREFSRFHLLARFWRADGPRLAEILRVGLPIGVILGFEVTVFSAAGLLIGLLGAEVLAAHAVALQIASVAFMVPLGIGQAATVRVGLAAGRGERAGVARAGWTAFALGTGFMVTTAALMIAFPWTLVGLFLDLSDPAGLRVAELAVGFLAVAGLFQIADGAQVVGAGALRGLKDTRVPMLLAGFGYWIVGMPLGALLAFRAGLGGLGIWIGLATGLLVVAVLMAIRWSQRERLGLVDGLAPAP